MRCLVKTIAMFGLGFHIFQGQVQPEDTWNDVTEEAKRVVELIDQVVKNVEANEQVMDILRTVVETYGHQDTSTIMSSVEAVELSPADNPEQKLSIRDISFHTIMLVPSRIETTEAITLSAPQVRQLNTAMGY